VNKDDLVETEKDILRMVHMDGFVSTVVDDLFREEVHTVLIKMVLDTSETSQIKMTLVLLACISSMVGRSGGDNFSTLDLSSMRVHMELVVVVAMLALVCSLRVHMDLVIIVAMLALACRLPCKKFPTPIWGATEGRHRGLPRIRRTRRRRGGIHICSQRCWSFHATSYMW
jgi:hypothetical protein